MKLLPLRLQPGDTVGIVSPSWGGAGHFPHRVDLGVRCLEKLGYKVKMGMHALKPGKVVSDTPANRASDIHDFFRDPEVRAIIAAIGGDHSCHLLPLLDFELIQRSPKILMGFSDITVLNAAIFQQTGLVTFNGPALLTDFAEFPKMLNYTQANLISILTEAKPAGQIEPAPTWTEEFLDWGEKKDLARPRTMTASPGWTWLKPGRAEGFLLGGCIESLQHLRGTRFWPDWRGAIFFWETSEDKPSPDTVDGIMMDYENMGVFDQIHGMLVGRPMSYNEHEKQELREVILERTRAYSFPVVTDLDFGHTSPQMTLPLGVQARIDPANRRFEILEAAVR